LSLVELSNVLTILMYLKVQNISGNYNLDCILIFLIIYSFNCFLFLKNKRYQLIEKKITENEPKYYVIGTTAVVMYTILSFYLFISNNELRIE